MKINQNDRNKLRDCQSDSVMDLLVAQCSDLEGLLALSRREALAAKSEDFGELLVVFDERARLGARLESYHRQVAELRDTFGQGFGTFADLPLAAKTAQLVTEIQRQDVETTALLRTSQTKAAEEIARLDIGQRNSVAYLNGSRANGLHCDRRG
jgi:hypothetical protein